MCCEDENLLEDDYDDCYELDTIDEEIYTFDYEDEDVDEHWAKAWTASSEGFQRSDYDYRDGREVRVFPTRYRVNDFRFTKRLRRVLNKNKDLKTIIRLFRPTEGKDDLYTAHLHERFKEEKPRYTLRNSFQYFDYCWDVEVMELCVFKGQKLVACSVFFVGKNSVVSRIGFWDTNERSRSLGILTILLEIKYAKRNGKEFYYLGDLIRQDPNYHYKTLLPALELWDWDNECWVDYKSERIKAMFDHKFRCKDDLKKDIKDMLWFIELVVQHTKQITAAALFGSHARGTATEDSDFDVLVLTEDFDYFFKDNYWVTQRFHRWRESKIENRGEIKILRAFFKNNQEIEFNFAPPEWAKTKPPGDEMRRLVGDGMKILHDPQGILEKLQKAISVKSQKSRRK